MKNFIISRTGEKIEIPPYLCKLCEEFEITQVEGYQICRVCHWQDDWLQNDDRDFWGGANELSYNQYKSVWLEFRDVIIAKEGSKGRFVTELFRKQNF
ncbi:MAG: hypothetical protein FWB72_02455 [Firmicutes bacterium]|nr:hypothetical protein [Bacillota bacterium]